MLATSTVENLEGIQMYRPYRHNMGVQSDPLALMRFSKMVQENILTRPWLIIRSMLIGTNLDNKY